MTTRDELPRVGYVALACFLWFRGHKIESSEWKNGLCTWLFEESEEMRRDASSFHGESALVNPKDYFPKVTEFKRLMYRDKPA